MTGGIYFGEPKGFGVSDKPGMEGSRTGYNTDVYCEKEIERLARVGFNVARKRGSKVCSVDKANVLEVSQLWREVATRVRDEEFPDIELSHMYVDNAAMQLVRNPKQFDTMITGNIFGDILSDEASMICGSIGMLPSASIGEDGPGLFEPIHGSAPDIAGQDISNPLAMILSAAMMLRYDLDEEDVAAQIEKAVEKTLDDGFRTGDLMSEGMTQVGCREMGDKVLERL